MEHEVREVMTRDPQCCTADWSLQKVARLMVEHHCGAIPIVDNTQNKRPIGMITDRDICCRGVAKGRDIQSPVRDYMTTPIITVKENDPVEDVMNLMEENKIRRVVVVDREGRCCGIVSQKDLSEGVNVAKTGEVVREISPSKDSPSAIH